MSSKKTSEIIKSVKEIKDAINIEFIPGIFAVFDTILAIFGLVFNDKEDNTIFIVCFLVFMIINSICYIYHGYNVYKHKKAASDYKSKTLKYLTHHRKGIKNIMETENNRNKLITLLYQNLNVTYQNIVNYYTEYIEPNQSIIEQYGEIDDDFNVENMEKLKNDNEAVWNYCNILNSYIREGMDKFTNDIRDTHNRFFAYTFARIKSEIEHYLSERNIYLDVSVTLKLFSNPCDSIKTAMKNNNSEDYFVYTSFRDNATYHNTKRREIGQNKYHIENQIDFREAMKSPNFHYIYNNLEPEENSISSAYCLSYYNCGATVSLRMPNDTFPNIEKNEYIFYGFLCCDVLNLESNTIPMDLHISNILEIYGHIISEFIRSLETICSEYTILSKSIFEILYDLAKNSKGNEM